MYLCMRACVHSAICAGTSVRTDDGVRSLDLELQVVVRHGDRALNSGSQEEKQAL